MFYYYYCSLDEENYRSNLLFSLFKFFIYTTLNSSKLLTFLVLNLYALFIDLKLLIVFLIFFKA